MVNNFVIKKYEFNEFWKQKIAQEDKGRNRPVVYLLNNSKLLYVWETSSAANRISQHLDDKNKKWLTQINIIFDNTFNKSAILDIEQSLIQYFWADNNYKLMNKNGWQSAKHNYYQREMYMSKFDMIWNELRREWIAKWDINDIRNSDLFKYSPYNTLTVEQERVSRTIIVDIIEKLEKNQDWSYIIKWWAWTGKTVVLINMLYKLINACNMDFDSAIDNPELSEYVQFIHIIKNFLEKYKWKWMELKIAYVSPMTSLRATIKEVFNKTWNWLKWSIVMWPLDVVNNWYKSKEKYDIVFVDEAHRLAKRKNIWYLKSFDDAAKKCWLEPLTSNLLDFIVRCSKYRVLVYDKWQTIKWSDINEYEFKNSLKNSNVNESQLISQLRCRWWNDYMDYIENIFNCSQSWKRVVQDYDLKLFDNVNDMVTTIIKLDEKFSLCRNVAWYSWEWISKKYKSIENIIKDWKEDIIIDGYRYIWNMTNQKWILSGKALETIWCIHTTQWYDLNYVWIIFWKEIDYDENKKEIIINKNEFYDSNVKKWVTDEELKEYIINAYKVMMSRWIKWCYLYVCNRWLRDYLSKFMDMAIK